jgi:hypothetical protein
MAEVRTALPSAAAQITQIFDANTDADHQRAIAAGAAQPASVKPL